MKINLLITLLIFVPQWIIGCTTCNKEVQHKIHETLNFHNLSAVFLTIFFIALIIIGLSRYVTLRHAKKCRTNHVAYLTPAPVVTASLVLGIGLGGFLDGIVLHQILQWHEMLSNEIATNTTTGKSINMFWDGLFHVICFIAVCIGIFLLWKALLHNNACRSSRLVWSGLLSGWGIFNITEGIIDHHVFKIHNVRETIARQDLYNLSFIVYSLLLFFTGWLLYQSEMRRAK